MDAEKSQPVEGAPTQHSWFGRLLASTPSPVPPCRPPYPKPNFISRMLLSYLSPLMYTGYNRSLEFNDMFECPKDWDCERQMERYRALVAKFKSKNSQSPHWKAIMSINQRYFWLYATVTVLSNGATIGMALVVKSLIEEIEAIYSGKSNYRPAVGYAVAQAVLFVIYLFSYVWVQLAGAVYRQNSTSTITAAVYNKALKLSTRGRAQFSTSQISSLVTTDLARIGVACLFVAPMLFFAPIMAAVIGVLIYFLGVSALAGIALIVAAMAVAVAAGAYTSRIRKRSLPLADQRVSVVRETVASMRTLKFYGWEKSFQQLLANVRASEEACIKLIARINVSTTALVEIIPLFAGLLSFAVMSAMGKNLSPAAAFPALTLFSMIAPSLGIFAQGMVVLADAYNCFKRLETFFNADESHNADETDDTPCEPGEHLSFQAASFRWLSAIDSTNSFTLGQRFASALRLHSYPMQVHQEETQDTFTIKNINLEVGACELVMVIGPIGSGKSSLLQAIAGNMARTTGTAIVRGQVTSMLKNWSINATVRDNIVFGQKYDQTKYAEVLRVCQLDQDLELFTHGDLTEVGENGITLSGGQKARLALARGIYAARDIVLLDDVLSAVDSKVSSAIMEQCILNYIGDRIRIMSTHNLSLLGHASQVVFMNSQHEAIVGTLDELMENEEFRGFYISKSKKSASDDSQSETESSAEQKQEVTTTATPLMVEERRERGQVASDVIAKYVAAGSEAWPVYIAAILGAVVLAAVAQVMQSVFLNWWTADHWRRSSGFYIGVYAAIITAQATCQISYMWVLSEFVFAATSGLFRRAVAHVYNAPISFFDTTPFGRIVNRFTNDLTTLDTLWFNRLSLVFPSWANTLGSLILVFVFAPWAALCLVPLIVTSVVGVQLYRGSSREINRIMSMQRSKMFTQLTESIEGVDTIVGFDRAEHFRKRTFQSVQDNLTSSVITYTSMGWLGFRVLLSTIPIVFTVSMLCVFRVFHLSTSEVAMLVSIVPNMCIATSSVVLSLVETEKSLSSVERLYEYAYQLPQERDTKTRAPADWPPTGAIKFENLQFSYREGLPLVLRDFTLEIKAGEKIGICGRTGAGKSSLISCLFRLGELDAGRILVDGVDIAELDLTDLRSNICIIPQESVLFKGTVRLNLDPFSEYSDDQLWEALYRSGALPDRKRSGKFRLNATVEANGNNFSLGERQLLSLSRALVNKSKIIALDEATANVDHKTDAQTQRIIATEFSDATILCIAHRLQTIIGYDKIVVMEDGRVLEFGSPAELFAQNGAFRSLCRESDIDAGDITGA